MHTAIATVGKVPELYSWITKTSLKHCWFPSWERSHFPAFLAWANVKLCKIVGRVLRDYLATILFWGWSLDIQGNWNSNQPYLCFYSNCFAANLSYYILYINIVHVGILLISFLCSSENPKETSTTRAIICDRARRQATVQMLIFTSWWCKKDKEVRRQARIPRKSSFRCNWVGSGIDPPWYQEIKRFTQKKHTWFGPLEAWWSHKSRTFYYFFCAGGLLSFYLAVAFNRFVYMFIHSLWITWGSTTTVPQKDMIGLRGRPVVMQQKIGMNERNTGFPWTICLIVSWTSWNSESVCVCVCWLSRKFGIDT